jgi:hypothetical protein
MSNSTTVEHPSVQKQQRSKSTIYLDLDLKYWARRRAIAQERHRGHHVEINDIINQALQRIKDSSSEGE